MNTILPGGCVCGRTRYEITAEPREICDCHCVDCRRSSGAPFVTWGTVPRPALRVVAGEVRDVPHANRIRSFAACCGTHLFFAETAESETIDFTIASLDDPARFPPAFTIWLEDRLPWVVVDERRPGFQRRRVDR